MKFLISGGGTGGHIFPALSIANALQGLLPDCEILFVGAIGRMEMKRVPEAGYKIVGLNVQGLERGKLLLNIKVIANFIKSYYRAKKIVRNFSPNVAIGVGGYVSGAAMWAASSLKVPVVLQEQNSYAGITNRFLAKKSTKICVAYEGMERFFPKNKIILTGNPVRQSLVVGSSEKNMSDAYSFFGLDPQKKTLLVLGGSLGAKTINDSILENIDTILSNDIQLIWQTGKFYFEKIVNTLKQSKPHVFDSRLYISDFISKMDYAYGISNLVVSRSGASSISELCMLQKPTILVPSPNVAENHQYQNAMALVNKDAAILVEDNKAVEQLAATSLKVINNPEKLKTLSQNIAKLAFANSAEKIANIVVELAANKP